MREESTSAIDIKPEEIDDIHGQLDTTRFITVEEGESSLIVSSSDYDDDNALILNRRQDHMNELIQNQIAKNQSLRERLELIRHQRRQIQSSLDLKKKTTTISGRKNQQKQDQEEQKQEEIPPSSLDHDGNNNRNGNISNDADIVLDDVGTDGDGDDGMVAMKEGGTDGPITPIDVAEHLLDSLLRERQDALKSYQSIILKRKEIRKFLHLSQRWNVVNDCFHIWHQGPFGTINGLRLGLSEAAMTSAVSSVIGSALPSSSYNHLEGSTASNNNENSPTDSTAGGGGSAVASSQPQGTASRGYWPWSGSSISPFSSSSNSNPNSNDLTSTTGSVTNTSITSNPSETSQHHHMIPTSSNGNGPGVGGIISTQQLQPAPPLPSQPTKIPWLEINSALGHVALLLSCLASKNQSLPAARHTNLYFPYELYPMGCNSKIGLLRIVEPSSSTSSRYFPSMGTSSSSAATNNSTSTTPSTVTTELVTLHNLSYSDDSFSLFGKRNFNAALQCLLNIILKAAEQTIQRRDRTMALPHVIAPLNHSSSNGASNSTSAGTSNGGELGIGGLSVSYGIADPIEWTRAMKYVLTDVKWLVAYSAKHVDR